LSAYFAMRVETKYENEGIESAQAYYNQVFAIEKYQQFQADTDAILIADGYGDVLPVQE
jgi:hypothetical protein